MFRTSGFRAALMTAAVAVSALTLNIPARAGFSLEELAGFEVTHLRGVVNVVSSAQKVIEVVDPEGHKEIITVGISWRHWGCGQEMVWTSRCSMAWWWTCNAARQTS